MLSKHSLLVQEFPLCYAIFKTLKEVFPSLSLRQKIFHHTKSSLSICSLHPHPTFVIASDSHHLELGQVIVHTHTKKNGDKRKSSTLMLSEKSGLQNYT